MDVSLIIPIYKAESFLKQSLETIDHDLTHFSKSSETWELILVNDFSPDRSLEVAQNFAQKDKDRPYTIKIINNDSNFGKGGAVKRGILEASGKYCIFTDCDLAYPMSEVRKILTALQAGHDVAIASRVHPESEYTIRPTDFHYLYTRHLASRFFNAIARKLIFPGCTDTQAGLKGFTQEAAKFLFQELHLSGFSFDLELLHIAYRARLVMCEVPIHFQYHEALSTVDFITDALRILRDMVRIRLWASKQKYEERSLLRATRKLFIYADDCGLSPGITEGIFSAIDQNVVQEAAFMVNFPSSVEALTKAKEKNIPIGWHLNLTLGQPVSLPQTIPTLVQPNGQFFSLKDFLKKLFLRQISSEDILREIEAQWKVMADLGITPTSVNGHQHVHVFPRVRTLLRTFLTTHPVAYIRLPAEHGGPKVPRFFARLFLKLFKSSYARFWRITKAQSLPFYGLSLSGRAHELSEWKKMLMRIHEPQAEIMVHPGIIQPQDNLWGDDYPNRNEELNLILSPEWKNLVHELGFSITPNIQTMSYPTHDPDDTTSLYTLGSQEPAVSIKSNGDANTTIPVAEAVQSITATQDTTPPLTYSFDPDSTPMDTLS